MARSARRQTVRATCSAAPAGAPPARMKRRSGGSSRRSVDPALEPRDVLRRDRGFRDASGDAVRRIGEPRAEREQVALDLLELRRDVAVGQVRATSPSQAFSSSTSP